MTCSSSISVSTLKEMMFDHFIYGRISCSNPEVMELDENHEERTALF
jgi:hypothetical protein